MNSLLDSHHSPQPAIRAACEEMARKSNGKGVRQTSDHLRHSGCHTKLSRHSHFFFQNEKSLTFVKSLKLCKGRVAACKIFAAPTAYRIGPRLCILLILLRKHLRHASKRHLFFRLCAALQDQGPVHAA